MLTGGKYAKGGGSDQELLQSTEIDCRLLPREFIVVMLNLAHGLGVTQKNLGFELSPNSTRSLIQSLGDL